MEIMKQKKQPAEDLQWFRLDNAAKLFPAVSDAQNSNVFRLSFELYEPVERELLQQALDKTLEGFPSFRVRLRRGLFWYFLEHNPDQAKVHRDRLPPCTYFKEIKNKGFLFRVTYFKNRINLDLFHVLADGTGALQLIRTLVYNYLLLSHAGELSESYPPSGCEAPPLSRAEDSFSKYYDKSKKSTPFEKKAYHITGTKLMPGDIKIITGEMPVTQVLALAKQSGVTLTAYLSALVISAIYHENMPARQRKHPIKINIPVNLRNHFPSITSRNFFSCIDASYDFSKGEPPFEELLHAVNKQLKEQLNREDLSERINYQVATERNVAIRFIPLFLKNIGLKIAYDKGEVVYSAALSNLGRIQMPEYLMPYLRNAGLVMSPSKHQAVKIGVSSFGDTLSVTFSASIAQPDIARYFFRSLAEQGVEITLTTNEVKPR